MLAVTSWITTHSGQGNADLVVSKELFKQKIKETLNEQIKAGQAQISSRDATDKIVHNFTKVKAACDKFVEELDKQLTNTQIETFADTIVNRIKSLSRTTGTSGGNEDLKTAVRAALIALCSCVRQVASEIQFIGISMFGERIDQIKPTVDKLNTNLKAATGTGSFGGKTSADGTAQAVDNAIEGVSKEVNGLASNFEKVKKPVDEAVQGLESAVEAYDAKAQKQVKDAAKGAIDKAAKEISEKGHESQIDLEKKMGNFHQAHKEIADNLEKKLQEKVNEQLPDESISGGQVQLSKSNKYQTHVDTSNHGLEVEGKLPEAIKKIRSDGMQTLDKHMGDGDKINEQAFDGPLVKIGKELEDIEKLVSDKRIGYLGEPVKNSSGLKTHLADLRKALGDGRLNSVNKGLDDIKQEIERLRNDTFGANSQQISKAVKEIKAQVEELKKKLKSDKGNDVISTLNDLQTQGLGEQKDAWQPNGGIRISGLGKIKTDIEEQNTQLTDLSREIDDATDVLRNGIQIVLKEVQMKLSDSVMRDDVLDQLEELRKRIGTNGETDPDSLQGIHKKIGELQVNAFTNNPRKIEEAKKHVEGGLQAQMNILKNEVTNSLNELIGNGFGGGENWNGKDVKGFDHIHKLLNQQNKTLLQQPKDIQDGVTLITSELDEVRKVLQGTDSDTPENGGVIKNLEFMKNRIGNNDDEGLKKIKSEIDSVKKSQVPVITDNLGELCRAIQDAAAYADWHVNQMATKHIDVKLKGIQSGLDNLQLTDLAAAIKLCDDFLDKADEIERNTIDALWKHVDDEVEDAIKDLTKEARGLYVDSVREALELFARKVNEDLEQLPGEINRDRYVGYKGFMKYLQGPLGSDLTGEEHSVAELSSAFQEVFEQIEKYVSGEITRLHDEQNKEKNPLLPPTVEPYTPKLNDVYEALTELLVYLRDNDGGADKLTELVERMTKTLGNLAPSDFKHPSTPLLDTVSRGLTKFAGEFGNTYVSAYSGQRCREEHAHKYAKVLLSLIPMTYEALNKLMVKCESDWKALHITEFTADDRDNPLGNYLTKCGYRVSSSEGKQDGELRCDMLGGGIYELLISPIPDAAIEMHLDREPITNGINLVTVVAFLYNLLCRYFQVCHIYFSPKPRYPCTVRDMLSWLSGLQYTMVADKLPEHCKALLNRRCHDGDIPNKEDPVMAKCIGELPLTIAKTCSHFTALLTAIQGNGHGFDLAAYPYSVDFSNNRAKLHYPDYPDALLDMLRDIVCRLCRVLYFLYSQCCRSTARVKGWRECAYGRQVQSHHWQCQQIGTYSSTISTTTATITSSTLKHGCPPTSPLQSFLSDCCHGLLPHTLTAADMVIECANCLANQPGQQCLTPLGFWDLGFAASISGTGWDLAKRLGDMCRDADSCLFVLCRTLFYLCPAAPSSLADVFALYAQVLRQWDPHDRVRHRGGMYTVASGFISHLNTDGIDSLFPLWTQLHGSYDNHKLTSAIASLAGHDHQSHDALSSLFNEPTCTSPSGCAPYLQPLVLHANQTYPQKHAGLYITWIMYLAWKFWELLCDLLQALDIDCTDSGCATCPCQPGIHGDKDTCQCPSIVQCAGILPTLYRYGFTYRNANLLVNGNRAMRCGDLNAQLRQALHSDHFTELFRQIDQLIWHIRMPLLYCFSALWSLVALYVFHAFLYRMDVLRIRSHLIRTKASHLIDVKA